MEDRRPTPEAMLRRAAQEADRRRRGRLRIFFGAAPGVGKTFAMLRAARAHRDAGGDVVIGWVEPHGRVETEALAAGMERIPPREVEHRGILLRDLDLDAALARRPGLLLVDELAHTNAPGSRHARRFQDVQELLDAGISVWTTLNVQHIESVSDVVARITGAPVRETVPDSVFDDATEIELIDLPPEDLLRRMREGKVYVADQAARAVESFFRTGNLIALRELTLRRAAEVVDRQALDYRREHGIRGTWATTERVLVAVGPSPQSADVVRAACRMAQGLRAPWIALSVERPPPRDPDAEERARVADHLALAESLGASTLVVRGEDAAAEILAVARESNVTRIVVGKPARPRLLDLLRGSLVAALVRGSGGIDVLVTTGVQGDARPRRSSRGARATAGHYAFAVGAVAACTVFGLIMRPLFSIADHSMLYLLSVLVVALRVPEIPSLAAAILAVAALNFFFVEPIHTFAVRDTRHVLTFTVLLAVSVAVSRLTLRMRGQAAAAEQRERRTAALYALAGALGPTTEPQQIAAVAAAHVRELMQVDACFLLADGSGRLPSRTGIEGAFLQPDRELAVARWVLEHGRSAGRGTDTLPGAEAVWIPLRGSRAPLGVVGVHLARREEPPTPAQEQLLETTLAHVATALDRARLAEEAAAARGLAEAERTRSTLLASVSHDLRTPLSSIAGSAEVLLERARPDEAPDRVALLASIRDEAIRLATLVGDLLELTRLRSGVVRPDFQQIPVEEAIRASVDAIEGRLAGREIRVDVDGPDLAVRADPVLLQRALENLVENAHKFSPPGAAVEVVARAADPGHVVVEVRDRGAGLPPGGEERIFERFYRAPTAAGTPGHGLGLSICRAAVEATRGSVEAMRREGGGAVFRLRLPAAAPDASPLDGVPVPAAEAAP